MVKRSGRRRLQVSMNGQLVGHWQVDAGAHRFTYAAAWLGGARSRPLSLSLPLLAANEAHRGPVVERYFDNLLPDDPSMRERMRRRYAARSVGTFDLLAEAGRDCVGAIQLLPAESDIEPPAEWQGRALDESAVLARLRSAHTGMFPNQADNDDFRISLAGAQEKTALLRVDDVWYEPTGSTPTTHILKLPLGRVGMDGIDLSSSVANEWLCLKLLSAIGLPTAKADIATFGGQQVLVVERFDRRFATDGRTLLRLPQEDACQALGLPGAAKYEADGGPGIERMMQLWSGSRRARHDRECFFTAQLLFWLMAAPDGHAKNFSLFLEPAGRYSMTPLYDVMSVWPYLGGSGLQQRKITLAMGWHGSNRHYRQSDITVRHIRETARRCGFDARWPSLVDELHQRLEQAIDRVEAKLPDDMPPSVAGPIFTNTRRMMKRLTDG